MSEPTRDSTTDGHPPTEPELHWLGSRRFRNTVLVAVGLLLLLVGARTLSVVARRASPLETSLYGQWNLTPGAPASYRVFVRDARDGRPVGGADVDVSLVARDGVTVWQERATTDEEGFALASADLADGLAEGGYTLAVHAASAAGEDEVARDVTVERSFRVLVTTDKPLYQPGQTIHVRSLALATADLRPVAEREVVIEVRDANANKVFKKRLATSDYGLAAADFQLADQVATGEYTVSATVGDTTSERAVTVERYRLPKFGVEISTEAAYFAPGDVVRGVVSARYTFGEPVAGGDVEIVVSELVETFRPFATVEGRTDGEGRFPFSLALKDHFVGQPLEQGDALISFEVTVTDRAAHAQTRSLERSVTVQPIRVDVVPESGTLVPGVPNRVYVVTSYPDGSPARTTLDVEPPGTRVETDAAGLATVELVPRTGEVTVAAEDERGVRVRVRRDLDVDAQAETVLLRTDRAVYRTGETAKLTVLSAASRDGRVFLDVVKDRRTVLTKALDVAGGRAELALDLPADLFGTLELHAYRVLSDGNLSRDTRLVQVLRASDLEIRAELDRDSYRPGELAVLDFFVTRDGGEGVPAALSLAGVDEAVFALQEMRPGLERVYFALLAELLEPRYEIHGRLPAAPADVLDRPADEATAATFSAARGGGGPQTARGASYGERRAALRGERRSHFRGLLGAVSLVPTLLASLLVVPILLYGLRWPGRPSADRASSPPEMGERLRDLGRRWLLGLAVPVIAGFGVLLLGAFLEIDFLGGTVLLAWVLTILGCLVLLAFSVRRLASDERFRGLPLLRRFAKALPVAYGLGFAGIPVLLFAAEEAPEALDERLAFGAVIAMVLLWLAVSGSLAVVTRGLGERLTMKRGAAIFARRFARDVLPVVLVAVVLVVGVSSLRMASAPVPEMVFEMAEGEFVAVRVAGELERKVARDDAAPESSAAGLTAPTRVRRYFPETLLWRPELVTGEDGHARLEVPLADSITTWRLAAAAVSRDGELGSEDFGLTVFQDFFVDLDLPVALTQNDEVSVPVAVYNYLDRPQTVRLELREDDWYALAGAGAETLTLGPKEVSSVAFRLVAREPGSHALLVEAHGGAMADAVEREIRVEPDGEPFVQTLNGRLTSEIEAEFLIPDHALAGADDLVLKIYPGAFSQVMEGLDGIFQMPNGCFEQTSSTTYPNVLVLDYLREQGEIRPEVELKALEYINLGYQRLLTFEVPGGGFEWFGRAPAHTVLTAYGLLEFSDMSRVYEVDPAVIGRTRDWLYSKQQGDGSWSPTEGGIAEGAINAFRGQVLRTTAYVAWAMAGSGENNARLERAMRFVAENAAGADDPYTLALCANALVAGGHTEARGLLERLDAMKTEEGDLTWWTSTGEGVTFSAGDTLTIETTALAAYAYQEGDYRIDTAHRALAWLIEKKAPNGTWYSTQATVHAMRALLRGTGDSGDVGDAVDLTVAVNGGPAEELTITRDDADVHRLISLRDQIRKGWNKVSIGVGGTGNLAYQIVATHYLPWSESRREETEEALSIDLEYDTVDLETDDLLTCRVRVEYGGAGAASMAIVDLGIPPGFELLPEAFEEMLAAERIERYSATARQVILYFREIESGRPVEFEYRMRAKYPLEVKTPQSAVYPYYEPSVRDETESVVLKVR